MSRLGYKNDSKISVLSHEISALYLGVEKEDIDFVKFLLNNPKINVNKIMIKYCDSKSRSGLYNLDEKREEKTALHLDVEKVQLLCQKENIDVNMKTINSYLGFDDIRERITSIHFAIGNEDSKIVEFWLQI